MKSEASDIWTNKKVHVAAAPALVGHSRGGWEGGMDAAMSGRDRSVGDRGVDRFGRVGQSAGTLAGRFRSTTKE